MSKVEGAAFLCERPEQIVEILRLRTIAVVGLSPRPNRPSNGVARYLRENGYRIVPVRPGFADGATILEQSVYPSLAAIPFAVDVVDVFRRSEFVADVVAEVLAMPRRPSVLWLQDGVVDYAAARRAHEAGLSVVMDRCMLRDHAALFPKPSRG